MKRKILNLSIILFLIISLFVFTGCKKDNEKIDEKENDKENIINLEDNEFKIDEDKYGIIRDALIPREYNLIVTPKEIDDLIENMKDVIARGINYSL